MRRVVHMALAALAMLFLAACSSNEPQLERRADAGQAMSESKKTVERYMEAFSRTDHAAILACLTDDVEWIVPGAFHVRGKTAFDKEIEGDAFAGSPTIKTTRLTEQNDVVVAEGSVRAPKKDGGTLSLVFCDVFEMRDRKIRQLTSYLMEVKER
jgi:uncharacterized protein